MRHEHAFRYVECDIPEGITLDRWRAERVDTARRRVVRLPSLRVGRGRSAAPPRDED
jgi:hypothetical protein